MNLLLPSSSVVARLFVGLASGVAGLFATAESRVDFQRDIQPILAENCLSCHGFDAARRKSGVRFDIREGFQTPSESGKSPVIPKQLSQSELWNRISHSDSTERMPPPKSGKSLTPNEINSIRQWILQGAETDRHWAFVSPQRPPLPPVNDPDWIANPIDHFVLHQLDAVGVAPSAEAQPHTLMRRLSFDLRGIPPSPSEVANYKKTSQFDAYSRLVDRWMASPHYGERMAQDWLDAARYADTAGHAADVPRTMWLYRDWVIDSINRNQPFDQFTIEQLAGDLIPNATLAQRIATGFHRNSMQALGNNPRKEEFRVKGIVDRLETTGRVWMGVTVGCAECHDHKYDPLSTKEYYQLYAIFNNVPHYGERFKIHGPRIDIYNATDQQQWDQTLTQIAAAEEKLKRNKNNAERLQERIAELKHHQQELKARAVTAQVMDELKEPRKTFVHIRGNFENRGDEVFAGTPQFLPPFPDGQPVNRLTFAQWLVAPQNPLTARVIVNRIWAHYFGRGLVATTDDFGVRSAPPSHPQLLDWLAVEFMESGWNTKALHRLIVTSATYRQSSIHRPELRKQDPDNRWLARGPRLRLAAEQLRDSALAVSGLLTEEIGGPSVYPVQPHGVGEYRDATAGKWETSKGAGRHRRSLYTFWQRTSPYPSMLLFDAPSRERSCVRRSTTNTPLQALTLLNDPIYVEMAETLAQRIIQHAPDLDQRIDFAFQTVLSRPPNTVERDRFQNFIQTTSNPTEDDLTRWKRLSQVLLNLDETITKE